MSTPSPSPSVDGPWGDFEEWDEFELSADEFSRQELNLLADRLVETKRVEAQAAAERYRVVDEFRRQWEASSTSGAALPGMRARAMRAELAAALRVSERTIESLVGRARALMTDLPLTLFALQRGDISDRHVQVIVDEAAGLTSEESAAFEKAILDETVLLTGAKFARKARTLREYLRRSDLAERHRSAAENREVTLMAGRDGMADLLLHLPAVQAVAIYSRADRIARGLDTADDDRTLGQKRADVLSDLLLDEGVLVPTDATATGAEGAAGSGAGAGGKVGPRQPKLHRGIRPDVHVTVPVLSLVGASDEPASLEGYGPIAPEAARQVAAGASGLHRILTHPETGVLLSFGRDRYEVPAELKRYVRARDETCRFIGCNRPAAASDIDHTTPWDEGGETSARNLGCLCKGHHRLKHNSDWTVQQSSHGSGDYHWTSPLGRGYTTRPAIRVGAGVVAQKTWLDDPPPLQSDPAPF